MNVTPDIGLEHGDKDWAIFVLISELEIYGYAIFSLSAQKTTFKLKIVA